MLTLATAACCRDEFIAFAENDDHIPTNSEDWSAPLLHRQKLVAFAFEGRDQLNWAVGIREKIIEVMAMLDVELPPELVAPAPAPKGKASGRGGGAGGEEGEGRRLTVAEMEARDRSSDSDG